MIKYGRECTKLCAIKLLQDWIQNDSINTLVYSLYSSSKFFLICVCMKIRALLINHWQDNDTDEIVDFFSQKQHGHIIKNALRRFYEKNA